MQKKKRTRSRRGYRKIPARDRLARRPRRLTLSAGGNRFLPPSMSPEKMTIILDLDDDETLVHSRPYPPPKRYDIVVRPAIDGWNVNFYVLKRPFVDQLLEFLGQRFELVVFTAGLKEYASLVLDRKSVIKHRLYRDSCWEVDGKFVKDLAELGRDLRRVVIVDDNPISYAFQPENAIPIRPFVDDRRDAELRRLKEFFEGSDGFEDGREAVKQYLTKGGENRS